MHDSLRDLISKSQSAGTNPVHYAQAENESNDAKDKIKRLLWTDAGNTPESFNENAFNKTSDGTIYLKPEYKDTVKSNEGRINA